MHPKGMKTSLAPCAIGWCRHSALQGPAKGWAPTCCPHSWSPLALVSPHPCEECMSPLKGNKTPSVRRFPLLHTYRSDPYGGHKSPLINAPTIEMPFMER